MFAKSQGPIPGMDLAFPDVCKTPPFAIPIPLPNIALSVTAVPTVFNQFIVGMPAHNLMTMDAISNGDEAGAMGGVASQLIIGPSRPRKCWTPLLRTALRLMPWESCCRPHNPK